MSQFFHCSRQIAAVVAVAAASMPLHVAGATPAKERFATVSDRQTLTAVLDRSARAWSEGDLDGFMACYEDSPETTYIRPDGPVRGTDAIRAMYAARFRPGGRGMGRLITELLDVRQLGIDYALVTGRFRLQPTATGGVEAHGIFTLVFHQGAQGWRITSDHTS